VESRALDTCIRIRLDIRVTLETGSLEDIQERHLVESRSFLLEQIRKSDGKTYPAHSFHKPPCLGGPAYDLVSDDNTAERLSMLNCLEKANPVLLRGVSCLLKGRMAYQYDEFGEAACMYLWVAMDAAHSLILQRLRKTGLKNPSSSDAMRYFETQAGSKSDWEKFFEDHYDNRIRSIHPANRFGAEAIPQLLADDFLELYDEMIPFFDFFASNYPDDFPSETEEILDEE
jgi:hypothetical protein